METHSKLQLYGVLHLTFGFENTIANLIYINIIINKGRERNCSPYNTDGYICEDFNSLWTVPLLWMAVLCSVWFIHIGVMELSATKALLFSTSKWRAILTVSSCLVASVFGPILVGISFFIIYQDGIQAMVLIQVIISLVTICGMIISVQLIRQLYIRRNQVEISHTFIYESINDERRTGLHINSIFLSKII